MIGGCVNQGWGNSCGNMSWCFFGSAFFYLKKTKTKTQKMKKVTIPMYLVHLTGSIDRDSHIGGYMSQSTVSNSFKTYFQITSFSPDNKHFQSE
jgi:hypothetical protein